MDVVVVVSCPLTLLLLLSSYLSFRLLGSALPHLSTEQLKAVLSGEVMVQYGEHVVSSQVGSQPRVLMSRTSCQRDTVL